MNPRQFLLLGGIVLILVGILGFAGIIGPAPEDSLFGNGWWFDNVENWAHLILGVAGLFAAFVFPRKARRILVILIGIIGVITGLYSLFISTNFLGANLENPADTILHIAVGAWALWASLRGLGMREHANPPQNHTPPSPPPAV